MKNKLILSLGTSVAVFAPVITAVSCNDAPSLSADQVAANAEVAKIKTSALGNISITGNVPTAAELTTAIKAANTTEPTIASTTTFKIVEATSSSATVVAVVNNTDSTVPKLVTYTSTPTTDQGKADRAIEKLGVTALGPIYFTTETPSEAEVSAVIKAKNTAIDAAITFEFDGVASATSVKVKAKSGTVSSTTSKSVSYSKATSQPTEQERATAAINGVTKTTHEFAAGTTVNQTAILTAWNLVNGTPTGVTWTVENIVTTGTLGATIKATVGAASATKAITFTMAAAAEDVNATITSVKSSLTTAYGTGALTSTMTETEWTAVAAVSTAAAFNGAIMTALEVSGTFPSDIKGTTLTYTLAKTTESITLTVLINKATGTEQSIVWTIAKPAAEIDYTAANAEAAKVIVTNLDVVTVATSGAIPTADELKTAIKAKNSSVDDATTWAIQANPAATSTSATVKAVVAGVTSETSVALTFTVKTVSEIADAAIANDVTSLKTYLTGTWATNTEAITSTVAFASAPESVGTATALTHAAATGILGGTITATVLPTFTSTVEYTWTLGSALDTGNVLTITVAKTNGTTVTLIVNVTFA